MPPPVDMAVDGNFAGRITPPFMYELRGWASLPLAALALAGLMAIVLFLSRAPYTEQLFTWTGDSYFQKGIVVHVTFAFVVWYMGVHGALTVLMTAQLQGTRAPPGLFSIFVGRIGLYGAGLSLILLLAPVLADLGEPSLNNYIPVLDHPIYYAGLGLLAGSVALPVLRLLVLMAHERKAEAAVFSIAAAGVVYVLALVCILAAWLTMPDNVGRQGSNEYLMWGGGHVLQFANTALMLCSFYLIARAALGETPLPGSWLKVMMLMLLAGAAAGPLLYLTHEAGGATQRDLFTRLYWYALPIPTVVVLGRVAHLLVRRWRDAMNGPPEIKAVGIALFLFAFGGVLGFFEGSIDTRTPAHYHAMLVAVTLTFMALYFGLFLPLLGRRTKRRLLRTWMYGLLGGGTVVQTGALYFAGLEGVLRKTAGGAQDLDSPWKLATMIIQGVGGFGAVAGGIIFIFLAGGMLLAKPDQGVRPAQ